MPKTVTRGRPTTYKEEYCALVDKYLAENQDREVKVLKQANTDKGYEMYDTKLKVKLPTINGFALYIDVNEKLLYDWVKKFPIFRKSLGKIKKEQEARLLNMGLSGEYNSTIAKLVLSSNHGYKEREDVTTNDKELPTPIYGGKSKL